MVPQIPCDQELTPYLFPARPPHYPTACRVLQELDRSSGPVRHRGHEEPVLTIFNLNADSPHVSSDDRDPFPEGFADNESESLSKGLREGHVRLALKHIHLERSDATQVREEVDVGIVARMTCRPLEPQPAFGVVLGHGADHQQLDLREGSLHQSIGIDDPERVLPGVEPAHLTDYRPGRVELEPGEDGLPLALADVSILRTQRIDRGRRHNQLAESYLGRCVACGTEDCSVIFLQIRLQESQHGSIRGREIDMAPPDPGRLWFDQVP